MELIIEKDQPTITFDDIVIKIITKMWYPINYFKLSFGKQDKIVDYINELKIEFELDDNITEAKLQTFLRKHVDDKTIQRISQRITNYVPYRFIRPWFSQETRGIEDHLVNNTILSLQNTKRGQVPYSIDSNQRLITIDSKMSQIIKGNYAILESFTLFKLTCFLEKRNTSVPNISIKLSKPNSRSLNKATKLWKQFIELYPCKIDVFERIRLKDLEILSIDHFLPWSYFSHDEIWNTHPINKSVNSSKNNILPSKEYLQDFSALQFEFLQYIFTIKDYKLIEEYCTLLKLSRNELIKLNPAEFASKFKDAYTPHFEKASSMGFDKNWKLETYESIL